MICVYVTIYSGINKYNVIIVYEYDLEFFFDEFVVQVSVIIQVFIHFFCLLIKFIIEMFNYIQARRLFRKPPSNFQ